MMEPTKPMPTGNISFGEFMDSCVNISDIHCYICSEGRCRGKTCDFYETRDGSSYRKGFAMFSPVTGPKLEPSVDLSQFRTSD